MSPDESFIVSLLRALRAAGLEAIIIGNAAAAIQGVPVTTQDVDADPRYAAVMQALEATKDD